MRAAIGRVLLSLLWFVEAEQRRNWAINRDWLRDWTPGGRQLGPAPMMGQRSGQTKPAGGVVMMLAGGGTLTGLMAYRARERAAACERIAQRHERFAREERELAALLTDIADRLERGEEVAPGAVLRAATPLEDTADRRLAAEDAAHIRTALDYFERWRCANAAQGA